MLSKILKFFFALMIPAVFIFAASCDANLNLNKNDSSDSSSSDDDDSSDITGLWKMVEENDGGDINTYPADFEDADGDTFTGSVYLRIKNNKADLYLKYEYPDETYYSFCPDNQGVIDGDEITYSWSDTYKEKITKNGNKLTIKGSEDDYTYEAKLVKADSSEIDVSEAIEYCGDDEESDEKGVCSKKSFKLGQKKFK